MKGIVGISKPNSTMQVLRRCYRNYIGENIYIYIHMYIYVYINISWMIILMSILFQRKILHLQDSMPPNLKGKARNIQNPPCRCWEIRSGIHMLDFSKEICPHTRFQGHCIFKSKGHYNIPRKIHRSDSGKEGSIYKFMIHQLAQNVPSVEQNATKSKDMAGSIQYPPCRFWEIGGYKNIHQLVQKMARHLKDCLPKIK